ncbi:MAG: hypothetical protein EOP54_22930 [Sphingobacteriales bacterium]|nr:MAG: hypothetical protein EOP54_22930 [Sphingobacteriales bacterium]
MKKIVLSLSALFAVSIASAQSYISQPDRTTYEVREYKAVKKADTPEAAPQQAAQPEATTQEQPVVQEQKTQTSRTDGFTERTTGATVQAPKKEAVADDKKVVENRKK